MPLPLSGQVEWNSLPADKNAECVMPHNLYFISDAGIYHNIVRMLEGTSRGGSYAEIYIRECPKDHLPTKQM